MDCPLVGGVIAIYVNQLEKSAPEPVKTYKIPESVKKQKTPEKVSPVKTMPSIKKKPIENEHLTQKHSFDTPTTAETPHLRKKDEVFSEEAIQKWVTEMLEELEQLDKYLLENYPELFEIGMMTQHEFFQKYSTPEEQQELLEYAQRVQPEVFSEIHAVFSNIPIEIIEEYIVRSKGSFCKNMGARSC